MRKELLRSLTRLGQALAELKAEVEVPKDIPYLGIKAGRYDVQESGFTVRARRS